jgi:hypothetical protein
MIGIGEKVDVVGAYERANLRQVKGLSLLKVGRTERKD